MNETHTVVIFGASGDLTGRKLIPALYNLHLKKRLPEPVNIVGFSRTVMDDQAWRDKLKESAKKFAAAVFSEESWASFGSSLHYHAGDIGDPASFVSLAACLDTLEAGGKESSHRLFYLATAPEFYGPAAEQLGAAGLSHEEAGKTRRVVIEKPFGTDLDSAQRLNGIMHRHFEESQMYRIDHYLGKETVNNILVLRFANAIFEPIWNRNYIGYIEITANEDVLVGRRAPYYENAGVLRDMFQNHLLQILTFVAMEPPARFDAKAIRDEKVKVLQSIRAMTEEEVTENSVRGQYRGYRDEVEAALGGIAQTSSPQPKPEETHAGPDRESRTATYAAMRLFIDNWRWKDVPVYLRSGKGMPCRSTQIVINFRQPPHSMFRTSIDEELGGDRLLLQIQPAEGIQIHFMTKIPDSDMKIRMSELNFNFKSSYSGQMPDSYERLLLDAMNGDASLFARNDEVEAAWKIIDPVQKIWDSGAMQNREFYEIGSTGPSHATRWIESLGHSWYDICPVV
ncbi:MAG: glucose-6-phosphate dehydrogenase [Treponema sp.]|jgi:glucose-6-phosphate 1-dehydrogenase|nr:glucose-6-phosphate dehydrogenase [Treponema sp.]